MICYFAKGEEAKTFNLDSIRVPHLTSPEQQLRNERVPAARDRDRHYNRDGKNPGNVWIDIPGLTYKSKELVDAGRDNLNTIQKPELLIKRLVLASSNPGDMVLDPFTGTGTCAVVCRNFDRKFIAIDSNPKMIEHTRERLLKPYAEQLSLEF